jgi:hypothetical protein
MEVPMAVMVVEVDTSSSAVTETIGRYSTCAMTDMPLLGMEAMAQRIKVAVRMEKTRLSKYPAAP